MRKIRFLLVNLLLVMTVALSAQNRQVTGFITDADSGEPIVGVAVQLKGSATTYAMSDDFGKYTISVPADGVLTFTFMGYETPEVPVAGRSEVNVSLKVSAEFLKETVVVAFGTSTKEAFTGSAAVVDSEKLVKTQATDITKALAGAVPGVQLTSGNGAPGSGSSIRIRGFSSMSAGMEPLIIVDGAPYSGDLNNLSQSDIESMTVLKDAASNALYGARGANGVIMITTKKASRGEAVVTVDIKSGVNQRAMKDYNTFDNAAMYYETHFDALKDYYMDPAGQNMDAASALALANANIAKPASDGGVGYMVYNVPEGQFFIGADGKINPNATLGNTVGDYYITPDNWNDAAYRNGVRQEYTVSVSGANEKSSFYSAVSYLENQGITDRSDMSRLTARLKADYQAKEWLKVGANFAYTKFDYNTMSNNGSSTSSGNVWAFTSQMAPIYPLYLRNADGSVKKDQWGFDIMDYGAGENAGMTRPMLFNANALSDLRFNTENSEGNALSSNGFVEIDIIKGLQVIINGAFNLDEFRGTTVYNPYYGQFTSEKGSVYKSHGRSYNYNLQQLVNYNTSFGKHNVGAMAGHEYYNVKSYSLSASKKNMFSQNNMELSGAVLDGQSAASSQSEYNNEGYFLRAQYDYDTKIFASASYRRDASSRFAPENRWGNFWSVGAAYILSKENWFKADWVDELKVKFSVGSQGNDNIGSYMYTDTYTVVNSGGNVSTMFSGKGSRNITWETNTNINTGVEFSLFKNKLNGSLEYFNRTTTDMLYSFPVAPSMGYSSYYANVGDMKNYGAELVLNYNVVNKKNVTWDISVNGAYLQNRIYRLDDAKKTIEAFDAEGNSYKGYQSGSSFIAEGLPMYSWYMREFAGIDQETGESLWYKDVKDEKGVRTGERETTKEYAKASYYINNKTAIAPFYGGFGTSVYAYGFDFSINCSYQLGGTAYDSGYAGFMASPTSDFSGTNFHVDVLKSWTPENKSATLPRFQYGDLYTNGSSTRFFTDASYLNIENINVGYTLPSKWTTKVGGEKGSLRIYFACENVAYWSKRQGFDPRQGYGSAGAASYSPMRTISGGITVKF